MKIELKPVTSIKPYPNNPRINDDAVESVAASIREFGFRQPIVVDTDSVIICGHTRYKAALQLGLEKVPVHVAKDLTPEQIKAYRIADNKTAELAEWNFDLLPIEIGELQACNYDRDLPAANTIWLDPLREELSLEANELEAVANATGEDRFDQVIQATVRVTVSNVCGSGTVVGRDDAGNAIVLTNAHVAGTNRGRTVNLERWNSDGTSERGTGAIIAAGYGRGMSVDFALLKCNSEFAKDVTPIPLADRYPNAESGVTTFGCPRCEWPSLQVLKLNRSEGQVLSWKPEAIGGRSGSSIIDYTSAGPRVVGLLTWGGGGEGLGQSTPFLLDALRGKLPASIESLPSGVREVATQDSDRLAIYQVPSSTTGEPLYWPVQSTVETQDRDGIIDSILERPKPDENGLLNRDRNREPTPGPIARGFSWIKRAIIVVLLCAAFGVIGFLVGRWWK